MGDSDSTAADKSADTETAQTVNQGQTPAPERRKSLRKRVRFVVKYRTLGGQPSAGTATAVDYSATGVAIEGEEMLQIGSRLEMQFFITGATHAPVIAQGRVLRVAEVPGGKLYHHGIAIDDMSTADRISFGEFTDSGIIDKILRDALKRGASDVHLVADRPPMFRIAGNLTPAWSQVLDASELDRILMGMMNEEQNQLFRQQQDVDFSYTTPEGTRFRFNVHMEMGRMEAAIRSIASTIAPWDELGLPDAIQRLAKLQKGLIIVSGPAGSGKSTTLVSIVNLIRKQRQCMIISIEDPVEYVYSPEGSRSVVKQREVGTDTPSFASALRHVLRQDPNVILVGEIRDLDSTSMAITAAETGHLVLTTLHTPSAIECINRIVDAYPAVQQAQARSQLGACLQGVIAQILLPRRDMKGRVLATEVLIATPAVSSLIRQGQMSQLASYLEGGAQYGMHLMDKSLHTLVERGLVELDVARSYARNPGTFANLK